MTETTEKTEAAPPAIHNATALSVGAVRIFEQHITRVLVNRKVMTHAEAAALHLKCAGDVRAMPTTDLMSTMFKETLAKSHDQLAAHFVSPEQLAELRARAE